MSKNVTTSLPVASSFGETMRPGKWWIEPLAVVLGLGFFITYSTWAAFQGEHYHFGNYLSPFYSPELFGESHHAVFGPKPSWWLSWLPWSPAFLILWAPGGFRFTCYYYRGAYMDCIRAMDFLCSRKEVNPDRIAVIGGSQGGGLSLATAAMDKRVSLCAPAIPFLTNWRKYFRTTHWPEMNKWIAAQKRRTWDSTLKTLSYFDTMNMGAWIRCPVFMGVGLQDSICPPPTNFAVYNRVKGAKQYRVYAQANHSLGPQHHKLVFDWIRTNFNLQ